MKRKETLYEKYIKRFLENKAQFGDYEDNIVMMMYDSVVIKKIEK